MARVIVVGSINQDITVTVDRFPDPGETLSGTSLSYGLGGKGANQAAAVARSGVPVVFVGAVGSDLSGQRLRSDLASHGVDVTHLREVGGPTGTALITVTASGENTIILDAGANRAASIEA
ncbi:MAG: PfkB family carbohydrate kinase, partial [Pauljensenia sp.]